MTEPAIGFADHAREIAIGNAPADKGTDHVDRDLGVRLAGETRDRLAVERRPGFRDIESAIAGETREHHLDKIKRGGLAPC
jgi:hypothetical protein